MADSTSLLSLINDTKIDSTYFSLLCRYIILPDCSITIPFIVLNTIHKFIIVSVNFVSVPLVYKIHLNLTFLAKVSGINCAFVCHVGGVEFTSGVGQKVLNLVDLPPQISQIK